MAPTQRSGRGGKARGPDELTLGTDKLYFKIGEVAEIVDVAPHVLRYWETEFAVLKPRKSRTQQRVYRRRDVATLLRIKHLLYVEKFTIAGARKQLRKGQASIPMAPPAPAYAARQSLAAVWKALEALERLVGSAAELDPAAADPADYLRRVGGPQAAAEEGAPSRGLLDRPERSRGAP